MSRDVASYSQPCSYCGAQVGDPCLSWRRRAHYTHAARKRLVVSAGAEEKR